MMNQNPKSPSSSSSSPRLDCDVGLALKIQPADSYFSGRNLYGVADTLFQHRSFQNTPYRGFGFGSFTATQWEELERQKMAHKYIAASMPVPPQLLSSFSRSSPLSQCNMDPEPWRCKRTDGKKWRCSRDVAPDLKYCERHAHKSKSRSRKLVELSSHRSIPSTTSSSSELTPYQQTRCTEWFMQSGNEANSISAKKQQCEHVMQLSSTTNTHKKNMAFEDKHGGLMSLNPYIPVTSNLQSDQNHILDAKLKSLTQTTRHFIDAWEKEGSKGLSASLTDNFPISPFSSSSSLSLSMCGGDYDTGKADSGIGMMVNSEITRPQWMNSLPGGPLGEALCLGNTATRRGSLGNSNLAWGHGYGGNSSVWSKRWCEDGSYGDS